ncbi:hypothetical protein [Natronoglomus mannanivorans]|uniref:Probable pectate lyase C n=1 Tax=Natronoglomus mannanivorans TaxID=2979990 RepID=A0AAP3E149_9EURY|nr:pectate lyase [Halobacteria archaeon AArc-xg1-1]
MRQERRTFLQTVGAAGIGSLALGGNASAQSDDVEVITLENVGAESPSSEFAPDDGFADLGWLTEGPLAVVRVTSLDSDGEGSFKWATQADDDELGIEDVGRRIIVFEVGGVIDLGGEDRWTRITNEKTYVAGQTAPSPGITLIRGGINVSADDCVIQHIRVCGGHAGHEGDANWHPDSRTDDDSENIVWDHCTSVWGLEQTLSVGYDTVDTTFTNNLIAEGLNEIAHRDPPRGYGTLVGDRAENVTLAGNVWAHNRSRNPRLKNDSQSAVVNNVLYNYDWGPTLDDSTVATIEGNAFLRPVSDNPAVRGDGQVHVADNYTDGDVSLYDGDLQHHDDRLLWPESLDALPSSDVLEHNLANVGARPAERIAVEERILQDVAEGTGDWVDHEAEGGGYPDFEGTTREIDSLEGDISDWLSQHTRAVELGEDPPGEGPGTEPPAIDGTQTADTTGDGLHNDFTGSGSTTTTDVNVFFENVDNPDVTNYPQYYDFDGNGQVSVTDVVELFEHL